MKEPKKKSNKPEEANRLIEIADEDLDSVNRIHLRNQLCRRVMLGVPPIKRGSKVHRFPALQPIPRQFMFRQLLGERALHCK
jgi:hypothetical protein